MAEFRQARLFPQAAPKPAGSFIDQVRAFEEFGQPSVESVTSAAASDGRRADVPTFTNEFWTSKQRAGHSLHEISYRACFKAELPRFFIERLTSEGDAVYDPFMGRGTTLLEAALLGRVPIGNDINPLSGILLKPRLSPPAPDDVAKRLDAIPWDRQLEQPDDLLAFYHPETLTMIGSLRQYMLEREAAGELDPIDEWIRMVAVNRLSGHSQGFFSVYTMPPNQAVSAKAQRNINARRNQTPEPRDVPGLILRKTKSLLRGCTGADRARLQRVSGDATLFIRPAEDTPDIPDASVSLAVTSPPFLNIVNYAADNWLRCWFCGIDPGSVEITTTSSLEAWRSLMTKVFAELARVLLPGGHVAFEVGEIRKGKVRLEESVIPCGIDAGLQPLLVMINDQDFTKTAHCWGVTNRGKGTNTNRIVVFKRPDEQL